MYSPTNEQKTKINSRPTKEEKKQTSLAFSITKQSCKNLKGKTAPEDPKMQKLLFVEAACSSNSPKRKLY
ncbi:MAG: hypothetical protein ACOX2P_08375 [Bacillota bacterium]|jgi:hypothetical protein